MLLERLQSAFGLTDLVHDWVQSFLTDRTQQIAYSGQLSSVQSALFEVPQGSVLGLLLYVLYTAELALVVDRHGLSLHQYANDQRWSPRGHGLGLEAPRGQLMVSLALALASGKNSSFFGQL